MKLVVVQESEAPEIIDVCDEDLIIVDHKLWWNLEKGDLMQILNHSSFGTCCYLVTEVLPQEPHGDRFVRITEAPFI